MIKRPIDGISSATKKRFAESNSPRREIIGFQFGVNTGVIILVAIGVYLFQRQLQGYTGIAAAAPLLVLLLTVRANFTSFQSFLVSIGRLGTQTWINTLQSVLVLTFQLLFVVIWFSSGVVGMVFGLVTAEILLIPLTHFYLRTLPKIPSKNTLHSVLSFAKYSVPSGLVGKAYDRFDVLLLGFLAAPAVVGYYEVALKLTIPTMFVAGVASSGLMTKISDLHSRHVEFSKDISNVLAFASVLSIPIFFGALAIAEATVVTAYGPEYRQAASLLIGLALYRIVQTQSDVLVSVVNGIDEPQYQLRASSIALIVNIILGIVLFFQIQALGVVIATVIAEGLRYLILYFVVSSRTKSTLLPRALLAQMASGFVMFGSIELIQHAYVIRSWIDFLTFLTAGGVVYFVSVMILSKFFRVTIRDIFYQLLQTYGISIN